MNKNSHSSDAKTLKGLGSQIQYNKQTIIPKEHFIAGDVSNRIAIPLSDGKTIVYTKSLDAVPEVKARWEKIISRIN